jgi:hypothetical protein
MTRRERSDSIHTHVSLVADARNPLEWPEDAVSRMVRPEDDAIATRIFDRIATSRAKRDWRLFDSAMIAELAVVTVELDKLMLLVQKSGWVTSKQGRSGTVLTRTPLLDPIQHLSTRQINLSRALRITGLPTDARTVANAAVREKDIVPFGGPVSLLAQPDDRPPIEWTKMLSEENGDQN